MTNTQLTFDDLVHIQLKQPDDFLIIKETLTRIGIPSKKTNSLYQSCHILHKQGRYAIVHFKELFALDGKETTLSETDIARRNTIVNLLAEWELVDLVDPEKTKTPTIPINQLKIIKSSEKKQWNLESKFTVGKK